MTAPTLAGTDLDSLNRRFAIPGIAQIVAGNGGLHKVKITTAAASAEVYLHGAHLTSWVPSGSSEVIFLSTTAQFQEGKAIRGGIPICFPWFNAKADDPKAPSHGFVRTKAWRLESITHEGTAIALTLSTANDDATRHWWPYEFHAEQRIVIGSQLRVELTVLNTGESSLSFEEALHAYYRVGQIRETSVAGLDGVAFQDNTDANREKVQRGDNVFTKRTDNAYLNTTGSLDVIDPSLRRRILIVKENSRNTVVWNPWQELAQGMSDLGGEEWQHMVCVEAANIRANAITLQPGEKHTMTAVVRAADLE